MQSSSSRRLFSESDEILILKTLNRLNKKLNFSHSFTSLSSADKLRFFNRIKKKSGTNFTQNQLTDKIRHLKTRYTKQSQTNASITSPHYQRLFKLSGKIWGSDQISESENNGSPEKEQFDLTKYQPLISEFYRLYPDTMAWREAFECLGGEKLREMNEEWLALGSQESKIMRRKIKWFEEQSKLLEEVFKEK